jgi:hypothetical protein
MEIRRAEDANRPRVRRGDVADVGDEAVAWIEGVEPAHHAIPYDLRHDGGGCDRGAPSVAVDECTMRRRSRTETKTVDEALLRWRMEIGENGAERCEVRAVEAGAVDLARGDDANADLRGAAHHRVKELLALFVSDLLRVVQPGERANSRAAQRVVVEKDAGDDERARKRAAPRLVHARDVPDAEAPVVGEEPLTA